MLEHQKVKIQAEQYIFDALCDQATADGHGQAVNLVKGYIKAVKDAPKPSLSRTDYKPNGVSIHANLIQKNRAHMASLETNHLGNIDIDIDTPDHTALIVVAKNLGQQEFYGSQPHAHSTASTEAEKHIFTALCAKATAEGKCEAVKIAQAYIQAVRTTPLPTLERNDLKQNSQALPGNMLPKRIEHMEALRKEHLTNLDITDPAQEALAAVAENLGAKLFHGSRASAPALQSA